ncbi:MAG: M48 family metalloprotease, partial [Phenylobacterium sp.]|uniref:M48 family metallopeptidase n=1 Tax=Phenylobacterium sp. TaxID=1871053 RepID=UPI002A368B6C
MAAPKFWSRLASTLALAASLALPPAQAQAQGMSLIRDTEIEATLRGYLDPLIEAAGMEPKNIELLLIGDKDLNAFAGPGVVGIHTGLILESDTPNQIQGVLAHEVGHLAAGHAARSGEMNRAGLRPFLLTMGLGVLAALAGSGEAAAGLVSSASYFGTQGAMGYTREQESRADQAGAQIHDRAGGSGRGHVEFFD